MFKENTFYSVTRTIDNRSYKNPFLLEKDDVILITKCVKNKSLSDKDEIRFDVDFIFNHKHYQCILWDKSRSYFIEKII